jgi:signal peptidase I
MTADGTPTPEPARTDAATADPSATTPAADPATPREKPTDGSLKDTVESILVAFILAFVFRAFVVEAFVIPTGSMAPTLLGAHCRFTCADCGYFYTVNYKEENTGRPGRPSSGDIEIPSMTQSFGPTACPNCGYEVPADTPARTGDDIRTNLPVHFGDRILVLKYRYLISEPKRWDVVVFKSPDRSVPPNTIAPPPYTQNFIKRLVGLPNETLMLLDGDVYTTATTPPDVETLRHGMTSIGLGSRTEFDEVRAARQFLSTFKVQRKPAYAQDAVWRVVHDNDYIPHLAPKDRNGSQWQQPWAPRDGSGWDIGQNLPAPDRGRTRVFRFNNATSSGSAEFRHWVNPSTHGLTDYLAYDQPDNRGDQANRVRDLRLTTLYRRQAGEGPFAMSLTKRDDRFTLEVTPGTAKLIWQRRADSRSSDWSTAKVVQAWQVADRALTGDQAVKLQLANVDYRVSVRINDREVLSTGDAFSPDLPTLESLVRSDYAREAQLGPVWYQQKRDSDKGPWDVEPAVEMRAEKQTCELTHVKIERDIFYINRWNEGRGSPSGKRGTPDDLITLGPDDFFTLGDNSLISGDARGWTDAVDLPGEDLYVQAGRVPRRFMLGKAFFVYWPAGHRPINKTFWGIVPNFGEMRFIQ